MAGGWDGTGVDGWLPERLAAESDIVKAERRMYNAWWGSFSDWIVGVKRAVTAGRVPDPHAVWSQVPGWADLMAELVAGPVTDIVGQAYTDLFGEGFAFDARPSVTNYLSTVQNRMVNTPDEVFDLISSTVARGAAAGDDLATVTDRVDKILSTTGTDRWRGRAATVARTETQGALNFGRYDSFTAVSETLGVSMDLVWLSTIDRRTREDHVRADGQRVSNPDGVFLIGGYPMKYPGDPNGPASQTISCRCTTLLLRPGEGVDMTGRGWQDPDEVWDQYREAEAAEPAKPDLAALDKKKPINARQLGGGEIADTRLLTYDHDVKVVEKVYGRRGGETASEAKHEVDAELLGAKVLNAVGVRTPETIATGKGRLLMEYLDGEVGAELVGWTSPAGASNEYLFASMDGKRMGLADMLMANFDRNTGNWLRLAGGRLAGIDHGAAFQVVPAWRELYGDFTKFAIRSAEEAGSYAASGLRDVIEFDRAELEAIRIRLAALRADFGNAKRSNWWHAMMARLKEIEARLPA